MSDSKLLAISVLVGALIVAASNIYESRTRPEPAAVGRYQFIQSNPPGVNVVFDTATGKVNP